MREHLFKNRPDIKQRFGENYGEALREKLKNLSPEQRHAAKKRAAAKIRTMLNKKMTHKDLRGVEESINDVMAPGL